MAKKISSNKPFNNRPNVRAGAGTIKYTWKSPEKTAPNNNRTKSSTHSLCNGPGIWTRLMDSI